MKKIVVFTGFLVIFALTIAAGTAYADTPELYPKLNPDGTKPYIDYPIDDETKAIIAEKEKLVQLYLEAEEGKRSIAEVEKALRAFQEKIGEEPDMTLTDSLKTNAAAKGISLTHQTQSNYYYCGPATASMIIRARGVANTTQKQAATKLGTTKSGTPWSLGKGKYPMKDTLNHFLKTKYYTPYGVNVNASKFKHHVKYTIDNGRGVAANTWEVKDGRKLKGHPNQQIFHWVPISGYMKNGNSIQYADSAHKAPGISWGKNVPKYSWIDYKKMATICNGRGIIW